MLKRKRITINDFTKKTACFLLAVLICFAGSNNIAMADTVTDYKYNSGSDNGIREVYVSNGDNYYFGCVDEEGNSIVAPEKGNNYIGNSNGFILIGESSSREDITPKYSEDNLTTKVLDAKGSLVRTFDIPLVWYDGKNGIAMLGGSDGSIKYALTDGDGALLTSYDYDYINYLGSGWNVFEARKGSSYEMSYGFLNRTGTETIPVTLRAVKGMSSSTRQVDSAHYVVTGADGLEDVVNTDGIFVLQPKYASVGGYFEGYCHVTDNTGKSAFFDESGKNVTGFIFDGAGDFSEGYAQIYTDGKWGYIDTSMTTTIKPAYDQSLPFKNGYAETMVGENKTTIENPIKKARNKNIFVDKNWIYTEEEPYIQNNRTMVPLRMIAEAMGCSVEWKSEDREIIIQDDNCIIHIAIDNLQATVNVFDDGKPAETVMLDASPKIVGGRTYVPLRFIAENMNALVEWEQATGTVRITSQTNIKKSKMVSGLPEADAKLYPFRETEGSYKGFIVEIKGESKYFDWENTVNPTYAPKMFYDDINSDGKNELIVILTIGTGTGVHIEKIHVIDPENFTEYEAVNPLDIINQNVGSSIMHENDSTIITVTVNGLDSRITLNEEYVSNNNWADEVIFKNIIKYSVEDSELKAIISAQVSPTVYIGEIIITYKFGNNNYVMDELSYVPYEFSE